MNSASQNFAHHLAVLRERMLQPTDYELAVHYFLEEFAGDSTFVKASDPEQMPQLVAVLRHVLSQMIGSQVDLEGPLVSHCASTDLFTAMAGRMGALSYSSTFKTKT